MKTILVPVDFSAITPRVCQTAVILAKAVKGRIRFIHSVPPPVVINADTALMTDTAPLITASLKDAVRQLAGLKRKLRGRGIAADSVEFVGTPVHQILDQARKSRADYIVMGSHGHGVLYDLFVGSTAHGVLSRATCPVLLVPPARTKARGKK